MARDMTDDVVGSIGVELVSCLAPEELPLFPALLRQFQGADVRGNRGSSKDQLLGFGVGESVVLLTPVILEFSRGLWKAMLEQAGETVMHEVLQHLPARLRHQKPADDDSKFGIAEIRKVRAIARQEAKRLNIPDDQAQLLADAVVGVLNAPAS